MSSDVKEPEKPTENTKDTGEVAGQPLSVFAFEKLWVSRLLFQENPPPQPAEAEDNDLKFQVGGSIELFETGGQVLVSFKVIPDQKKRPYFIELDVVGRFSSKTATQKQILTFCQTNAPVIMFPYVRQMVQTVTGFSKAGGFRLPLLNIQTIFGNTDGWVQATPTNAPSQPSEQSPSASPESKT